MKTIHHFSIAALPFLAGLGAHLHGDAAGYCWVGFGFAWLACATRAAAEDE